MNYRGFDGLWVKYGATLVALLSLATGFYVFIKTIILIILTYTPLPISDQWGEIISGRPFSFSWLFSQHFEHRILFPRLLFYIDSLLFSETNVFNYTLNILIPIIVVVIFSVLLSKGRVERKTTYAWSLGVSFSLLFWAIQQEAFMWGFEVVNFLEIAAAICTFAVVATVRQGISTLLLIIILEIVSVYSMISGISVPFIVIIMSIFLNYPRKYITILAVSALLLAVSYMLGYQRPDAYQNTLYAIFYPVQLFEFFTIQLGAPFACSMQFIWDIDPIEISFSIGLFGLIALAALCIGFPRLEKERQRCEIVFFAAVVYTLSTAAMTSLGRLSLGIEQAVESRYMSNEVLFWLALTMIAFCRVNNGRRIIQAAFMTLTLPIVLFIGVSQRAETRTIQNEWRVREGRSSAAPALLAGVADAEMLRKVSENPQDAMQKREILREHHASIFADKWSSWLGGKLADHAAITAQARCHGAVMATLAISDAEHPGWRASGWAWDDDQKRAPARIVFANQGGAVVGYGLGGFHSPAPVEGTGWLGEFVGENADQVQAFALLDNETMACPLAKQSPS